jgi:tetratricopeptide (TPR) repeat protein
VNNLANCLRALGGAAGALPLYRRALEGYERVLGADHPDTLASVNNLASCLRALGDAAGALPLYRRALEGYERVLGADHPNTLTVSENLQALSRFIASSDLNAIEPPTPHPAADPERAARLSIEYTKAKAEWDRLPWWKRIASKPPTPPTSI